MPKNQLTKPIDIKISTVVAVSAILHTADLAALQSALHDMTGGAQDYFEGEFTVLDVEALDLANGGIDWPALIALFKSFQLNPVAVRNAPEQWEADIMAHGLSIDRMPKPREAAPPPVPAPAQAPAPAPAVFGSMIVDTPVRAGQRIYARGADLIVMAAVNNGAEIIADGSIHVYAPLRGRALAGANGNTDARIFALSMEPELVSIAGMYRTFDEGFPKELAQQPAQVRLDGERLDIKPIHPAR